jgi:hypothetical protein
MTMKRNGGGVNELTFNAQLIVKLSVFSRLQSLINPVFRWLAARRAWVPHLTAPLTCIYRAQARHQQVDASYGCSMASYMVSGQQVLEFSQIILVNALRKR